MTISSLPSPPSRSSQDRATFVIAADAFLAALPVFTTEANQLASDVNGYMVSAAASAITAASEADRAEAAAGFQVSIAYKTYAALAAVSGTAGQTGGVFGPDAGTHTDPVVGGTVANEGIYRYSTSPAGWERIGSSPSNYAAADGSNATGTWPISITGSSASTTGNAATATTLQTARTINGTSFDGSANITTSTWGTSRTVTIGASGKAVDGSANVTWTLAEIGAVAKAGDTMTGKLTTLASAAGGAGLNLPHGAAPTTPTNGDLWTTTAGLYARINGSTVGPFGGGGGTVTSVSGTGTVNGITLSGTVTTSGSLTLGGTLSGVSLTTQVTGTLPVGNGGTGTTTSTGTGSVVLSASPTFTGTPAAPTAVVSTNTTQLATTAFVVAQVSNDAPTKTGGGASGTWGISITGSAASATGNAATATTLQTARTINGTSFNGSANITTSTWGTSRTITIGSSGKAVDGSANVTWTLAEIGAAPTASPAFTGTATYGGIEIGFRSIPRSSTTSGTLAAAENGYCIPATAGVTIPASVFSQGNAVSIYNNTAGNITITQGSGLTLRKAGTATTGNLTLASRGYVTIWFNSATEAVALGAGI